MPLIKDSELVPDPWVTLPDEESLPEGASVIVRLERWQAERETLIKRNAPLGLRLRSDQPPKDIAQDVERFQVIALEFPRFGDGRAYSYARLLRERYGFRGRREPQALSRHPPEHRQCRDSGPSCSSPGCVPVPDAAAGAGQTTAVSNLARRAARQPKHPIPSFRQTPVARRASQTAHIRTPKYRLSYQRHPLVPARAACRPRYRE